MRCRQRKAAGQTEIHLEVRLARANQSIASLLYTIENFDNAFIDFSEKPSSGVSVSRQAEFHFEKFRLTTEREVKVLLSVMMSK